MRDHGKLPAFVPAPPDAANVLSWIHFGDLHMVAAGQENHKYLQDLVAKVNAYFADSISFVYLPGDNADDGSRRAYAVVREALDSLQVPWCAIVGDHDVHEKSFDHFLEFMGRETYFAFTVGEVRFIALNAFDLPRPDSFLISPEQLSWCENELQEATEKRLSKIMLLHCYPSDLKQGGDALSALLERYQVRLVDMGHTHYNEISNDGRTIYTATRSTGQIEEGEAGFSVTSLDGEVLSWRFFEINQLPALMITSPGDVRLMRDSSLATLSSSEALIKVRVKIWSGREMEEVRASCETRSVELQRVGESRVWEGELNLHELPDGIFQLNVQATDIDGHHANDRIHILRGSQKQLQKRHHRDQDNAIDPWPEHGLLGTQLGPNKNGRKW